MSRPSGKETTSAQAGDATSGASPGQTPIERLLDIGLYAPLGLLANKGEVVRDLAAAGRKQVAFSRSLGRAALKAVAAGSRSGKPAPTAAADPTSTSPAIADYASLTAREVVALIPSCSPEQQEWIESTERAGKGRVTVLRALSSGRSS